MLTNCKKENPIPKSIEYESEIFFGNDTLIYGEWKYLYSYGGFAGGKAERDFSILSIKPIGKFVMISKKNEVVKGIISIRGEKYGHTQIEFLEDYQNGLQRVRGFLYPSFLITLTPLSFKSLAAICILITIHELNKTNHKDELWLIGCI